MKYVAKRILYGSDGWSLDPETFPIIAQCNDYEALVSSFDTEERWDIIVTPYRPTLINPGLDSQYDL